MNIICRFCITLLFVFDVSSYCFAEILQEDNQFDSYYLASADEEIGINSTKNNNEENTTSISEPAQNQYSDITNSVGNYIANASGLGLDYGMYVANLILTDCDDFNVDYILALSLFKQESNFNMSAVSSVGAIGIAQLMPATAESMGYNPYSLEDNIRGGVEYLSYQLKRFAYAGDLQSSYAIAAYNAGGGAVSEYGDVPPYRETRNHVTAVANNYYTIANFLK